MSKTKVLGEKYGIQITRPWNKEMYEHNDMVAEEMISNITNAVIVENDSEKLHSMHKMLCMYSMGPGYSNKDVKLDILKNLKDIQNYRLNEDYPDLVKAGYVPDVKKAFVGYDKN